MRLKKIPDTFNDYRLELSWGQIEAIKNALNDATPDPVTDELAQELEWYVANVPAPGQDEEEFKAQEEQSDSALPDPDEDDGSPIPMPPGDKPVDSIAGEGPVGDEGEEEFVDTDTEIDLDNEGGDEEEFASEETAETELPEPRE